MIPVNIYWIEEFLGHATGWHIDADDHPLNNLNMRNESSRAVWVESYLLPAYRNLSPKQRHMLKETLRYAINFLSNKGWRDIADDALPNCTPDIQEMFADVWGMMFQGETFVLNSPTDYLVTENTQDSLFTDQYRFGRV